MGAAQQTFVEDMPLSLARCAVVDKPLFDAVYLNTAEWFFRCGSVDRKRALLFQGRMRGGPTPVRVLTGLVILCPRDQVATAMMPRTPELEEEVLVASLWDGVGWTEEETTPGHGALGGLSVVIDAAFSLRAYLSGSADDGRGVAYGPPFQVDPYGGPSRAPLLRGLPPDLLSHVSVVVPTRDDQYYRAETVPIVHRLLSL